MVFLQSGTNTDSTYAESNDTDTNDSHDTHNLGPPHNDQDDAIAQLQSFSDGSGRICAEAKNSTTSKGKGSCQSCRQGCGDPSTVDCRRQKRSGRLFLLTNPDQSPIPIENTSTTTTVPNKDTEQHLERTRKRKKNAFWTDADMTAALEEHQQGCSMHQATLHHHIPYSTFWNWCCGVTKQRKRGIHNVLNDNEEVELVQYVLEMSNRGLGLSPMDLKIKVYEMTNTRSTPFKDGILGDGPLRWFFDQRR